MRRGPPPSPREGGALQLPGGPGGGASRLRHTRSGERRGLRPRRGGPERTGGPGMRRRGAHYAGTTSTSPSFPPPVTHRALPPAVRREGAPASPRSRTPQRPASRPRSWAGATSTSRAHRASSASGSDARLSPHGEDLRQRLKRFGRVALLESTMRSERTSGGHIKGQDREDMLQARDEVGQCEAVNGGAARYPGAADGTGGDLAAGTLRTRRSHPVHGPTHGPAAGRRRLRPPGRADPRGPRDRRPSASCFPPRPAEGGCARSRR
ncbi:hypothetical protein GA0115257_111425 [Streptomyces sp. LcepLS]|nr:hypothetical protein GA0115257_111425 [Streptomyces sp. LcepLS]